MPPSVTQDAAREHDRLMEEALYTLVGGARVGRNSPRWRVAVQQARLPVRMGGMGLTSAMDIREAAWVGTWALVTRPIRERDTNAVWVDARRAMTVTQERHTV